MRKSLAQMNGRERAWIDEYLKSGDALKATYIVYKPKSVKSAHIITTTKLSILSIKELLEQVGATDAKLARKLNEGLEASYKLRDRKTGEVIDTVTDYNNQHKFIETVLKLKGHLNEGNNQTIIADKMIIVNSQPDNDKQ